MREEYDPVEDKNRRATVLPEGETKESVKREVVREKVARIKRELEILERELNRLTEIRWTYAKRMLKFGAASWIFGLFAFFFTVVVSDASLIGRIPSIAISLLGFAAAGPILITAVRIHRFGVVIKRQECMRCTLLASYRRAILKRIVELNTRYSMKSDAS